MTSTEPRVPASPGSAPPLFRLEALERARTPSHGSVVLVRPLAHRILTAVFVALAAGIVAFFAGFSYTRKAEVQGILQPLGGLIRVVPAQAGVISKRSVEEGQRVSAGDVLFVLTSERASATRGDAEQAISALMRLRRDSLQTEQGQLALQARQRIDTARRRADDLVADLRRIDEQIAMQGRRIALAETLLARYAELQSAGFVSWAQVQDRQAQLLDQQERLADLQRSRGASARDLSAAKAESDDLGIQSERDLQAQRRSISATEQDLTENEARREILVRAPGSGIVTAVAADAGQTVSPGQSLAVILPQGAELEADLYAPSRAAGFVRAGMPVLLRYQAYAYQKFGQARGTVREVSRSAMRPQDLDLPGTAAIQEPLYRIKVTLARQSVTTYGTELALKPGTLVDGSILLDRRRLYEWVLDPLYTLAGRL